MRTFTLAFICLIYSGTTFSINQNPKNWEHGYLFEKQHYNGENAPAFPSDFTQENLKNYLEPEYRPVRWEKSRPVKDVG